jgi:hypothetical protein
MVYPPASLSTQIARPSVANAKPKLRLGRAHDFRKFGESCTVGDHRTSAAR